MEIEKRKLKESIREIKDSIKIINIERRQKENYLLKRVVLDLIKTVEKLEELL